MTNTNKTTEPTQARIDMQDNIDNEIFEFLNTMIDLYQIEVDSEIRDVEWSIENITDIRLKVENMFNLPNVY